MKHLLLAGLMAVSSNQYCETISSGSQRQVQIAQCLAEKSTFYGAYWCDWCEKQKEEFGPDGWKVFKKSYVECSDKSSSEEKQKCEQEKISAFPTWKFRDGKTENIIGYLPLEDIAKMAGCK